MSPTSIFRTTEAITLTGTMAIYDSQADASAGIPHQWRSFLSAHPELTAGPTPNASPNLYGASPCTPDHKIHYLAAVAHLTPQPLPNTQTLFLEAGEYAVVQVSDPATLRDTWVYLLTTWLPTSNRRERHAPEFERYTSISPSGHPTGPVEIWIPLEP